MAAAAIGMLVEDGKLDWDQPLKEVLPEWHVSDQTVRNNVTVVDCLAHRTGLQMNNYWLESNNNIVIPLQQSMQMLNGLIPVKPFRGKFQYNNLGYEVAGHLIEKLSGQNWGSFLQSRIFSPLSMSRSGTRHGCCGTENVAESYGALSDGSPVRISPQQIGDNTVAGAAGGARSSLRDLLRYFNVWLSTAEHQFRTNKTSTSGSPLKQVGSIMSAKIPTTPNSLHETSYAMGWARTELPGPLGVIGLNGSWLPGEVGSANGFPLVCKSTPSQLVVYHQGSNPGTLHNVLLLPETQSAIVVLTNTLALNDCADWVGQLLLESFLDAGEKNDYLQITKDTVSRALAWYPSMAKELRENRNSKIPRDPHDYVGVYWNAVGTMHIDVSCDSEHLNIAFQGLPDEVWSLRPWQGDIFTWLPESRDVIARRARFSFQSPDYYKIKFSVSEGGLVQSLTWVHEGWNIPDGEVFFKSQAQCTQ